MTTESAEMFAEPAGEDTYSGVQKILRQAPPYIKFINEENIPVHRGIGFRDVRELDLGDWERMGARGAFLRLDGLDDIKGMYLLEILGQGQTNPERHIYHEFYFVIEGRGTTETWQDEHNKRTVEWKPGSYFMIPPNINHRLVNATNERVLLLAATNMPPIINIFRDKGFIYGVDYPLSPSYDNPEFYQYNDKFYAEALTKRAQVRSNFFPDIVNCELPLDNQRAPGYRWISPGWSGLEDTSGTPLRGFIAQYPPGRYSRAHRHGPGAVLVCLRGKGYTFNWHEDLGLTPWIDGHGDEVKVQEYIAGGLVAAAPSGANWFHQHFGVSCEPLRILNYMHGTGPVWATGAIAGEEGTIRTIQNLTVSQGGQSVGYALEDPYVRELFEASLAEEGLKSEMPPEIYKDDV